MTYAGLTISDKPALLEAKARGAEWIAADLDEIIWAYNEKPHKLAGHNRWYSDGWGFVIGIANAQNLSFSDPEPVNIDLALAQIAEMESNEKALLSEKANEKGCAEMENADKPNKCEYCAKLSKYAGWGYAEWFEQRAVDEMYEVSVDVKFCPNCGNPIASPYTEGARK